MSLFPLWYEIARLPNVHLRNAMLTAKGPLLEELQALFPRCWSTEEPPLRVPVSLIHNYTDASEGHAAVHDRYCGVIFPGYWFDIRVQYSNLLRCFKIPEAYRWYDSHEQGAIPDEVWDQLNGRILSSDLKVVYKDEEHLICDFEYKQGVASNPVGKPIGPREEISAMQRPLRFHRVALVAAKYIDLSC